MRYCTVLTLLFLSMLMPLCAQWDANGQVQLTLRSYKDVVDEGRSIYSTRVIVDRFDRIVAVRLGRRVPDSVFSIVLERVLPNGEHDPSFGDEGVAVIPFGSVKHDRLHGVFVDSMGAIVVVANVGPTPFFARVLANGRLDSTYGTNGFVRLDPTFTCGKENGVANGHNVSIACSKVIDDTTTRCVLVHVSDRGIVSYEPYISSRCDRFLVYHHGEQFLASGRTIVKLDAKGLIDTTFGSYGSVRWRHLEGDAFTENFDLYDDTTLVLLVREYAPGAFPESSEYALWYFDTRTGAQLDFVSIPFTYGSDPELILLKIVVGTDGSTALGGVYRGDTIPTNPTVFRFRNRSSVDRSFYETGERQITLSFGAALLDLAVLSNTQLIAFVEPSFLVRMGDPLTSVRESTASPSFMIVPNPVDDHFTIRAPYPIAGIRYEIVSMLGAVVQEGQTDLDGSVAIAGVLTRGSYIVRISGPSHEVTGALLQVR